MQTKTVKSEKELSDFIQQKKKALYLSAQTSTVIPFDKLGPEFDDYTFVHLSSLPAKMELTQDAHVRIEGAVSWRELKAFLRSHKREIMAYPTEESALVLAGLSTSATGERSFAYGSLRSQVETLTYLNYQGQRVVIDTKSSLPEISGLKNYQEDGKKYQNFKNAPFPRLERALDLMIGSEGQLGVIVEATLKTVAPYQSQYLFLLIPRWEENIDTHLEILEKVQKFRGDIIICELLDSNSLAKVPQELFSHQGFDGIFLQIKEEAFEKVYIEFLSALNHVDEEHIFEVSEGKFNQIRTGVPRAVNEENARRGVIKKGTDVQVAISEMPWLFSHYQDFAKQGIEYNLFGHFGDCHLHFNFMPTAEETGEVQNLLENLYLAVKDHHGSPFAEHGIGVIKQKFIQNFLTTNHYKVFHQLKQIYDPDNLFFPDGFLSMREKK